MRLFFWGLVIVALVWLAYSAMLAGWSYIAVHNALDEVVSKDGVELLPAKELKARVMTAANEAGVRLVEKDVVIRDADRGVSVEVAWTVPVVIVHGDPVFAVPLSARRTTGRR